VVRYLLVTATVTLLFLSVTGAAAFADFGVSAFRAPSENRDGSTDTQAADHPYQSTTSFTLHQTTNASGTPIPDQNVKDVVVNLPAGFVGNSNALPKCAQAQFTELACPPDTQVGIATVNPPAGLTQALFNLAPKAGVPAQFGFLFFGVPIVLNATVRTGADYGVTVTVPNTPETIPVFGTTLTFWGVPAESSHDPLRGTDLSCFGDPYEPANCTGGESHSSVVAAAFLTNPSTCEAGPLVTTISADSWQQPGGFTPPTPFAAEESDGTPVRQQGCERVPFEPSLSLAPTTTQADAPSGDQAVDLRIPQSANPSGLAQAQLKDAVVSTPLGVTLNPGAADGLQACGDAQFALHASSAGSCPSSSAVGTVKIVTPLLEAPLEGKVFVGVPECAPCTPTDVQQGRLLRLFVQAQGSGVVVKSVGTATADPTTGQLTVTFKELPQQPFSDLRLTFKGGQRAAFINPLACGNATVNSSLTPWSGTAPVSPSASFAVDWDGAGGACPATLPFAPSFSAGTTNPQAGAFSTFTATFSRPDRNQVLNAVSVRVPPGLLGMLSSVPLCGEQQAAAGICSAASRIATAKVAAGTGSHPYWFSGPVYLTTGYKGAPFGLSIAVPAVAGPFNLGTVVTRAAVSVDPNTAQITITSDPFPQIIDGIRTHIQTVNVTVDRQNFTFNPTNCTPRTVGARITSVEGAGVDGVSSFQAANCATLPFGPRLSASVEGRASKAGGASLDVKVGSRGGPQQGGGEANIGSVKVDLPKQLPSRLTTLQKACVDAVFEANPARCPAASDVGSATAATPVLAHPLSGPAYLVSHGGAAFPDLEIVLQGEGVTIILDGNTDIKKGITSSTFKAVPDAPISSFELKLPTGYNSVLTSNVPQAKRFSLCGQTLNMPTAITGQNGAVVKQTTKIAVGGCPKVKQAKKKAKAKKAKKATRARGAAENGRKA
jgi:hypothetical protein